MIEKNRWNKKLFNWRKKPKGINSKKRKNVCRVLNYVKHSLIEIYTITVRVSISAVASLVGICVITEAIRKYESMIKKKDEESW